MWISICIDFEKQQIKSVKINLIVYHSRKITALGSSLFSFSLNKPLSIVLNWKLTCIKKIYNGNRKKVI